MELFYGTLMAKDTPRIICNCDNSDARLITANNQVIAAVGSTAWFEWLDNNRAFQFEPQSSTTGLLWNYSAQKERRKDGMYWIAYKRFQGKLERIHLGLSQDLTLEKLLDTSRRFPAKFHNSSTTIPEILAPRSSIIVPQPEQQNEAERLQACLEQTKFQEEHLAELREEKGLCCKNF